MVRGGVRCWVCRNDAVGFGVGFGGSVRIRVVSNVVGVRFGVSVCIRVGRNVDGVRVRVRVRVRVCVKGCAGVFVAD
jgi:hypothetical protein